MRSVYLAGLFLSFAMSLAWAGADSSSQQLLDDARQQADIFQAEAGPLRLEVDFEAQVNVPTQGHLTYQWESKTRWRRRITLGDFQEISILDGEKSYTSRNAQFTPVRVRELLALLETPGGPEDAEVKKQKERGAGVFCLKIGAYGYQRGRELCLDRTSREILSDEWKEQPDQSRRKEYSDYVEFRGHRWPRQSVLFVDGIKAISARVVNLTAASLDPNLLIPPKGAIERRLCDGMKPPKAIKSPDPAYPKSASENRLMGDTTVSMTVLTDGSIGDVQLIGSSTRSMDDATLQTLKSWRFKPAMCGTEPVVSDVEVVVSFRLR